MSKCEVISSDDKRLPKSRILRPVGIDLLNLFHLPKPYPKASMSYFGRRRLLVCCMRVLIEDKDKKSGWRTTKEIEVSFSCGTSLVQLGSREDLSTGGIG
jgi:hypothetical protein